MSIQNHYTVLDIPYGATIKEIRKAYIAKVKSYHPDTNNTVHAAKEFQKVSDAYTVLSDAKKKRVYDETLSPKKQRDTSWSDASDFGCGDTKQGSFFDDFHFTFNSKTGGHQHAYPKITKDVTAKMELPLREAVFGVRKTLTFTRTLFCLACNGSINRSHATKICLQCRGTGSIISIAGGFSLCSKCNGTGKIPNTGCDNPNCYKGHIIKEETLKVTIPPGVKHNQQLKIKRKGAESKNLFGEILTGDLLLKVTIVKGDETFKVKDDDIELTYAVNIFDAFLGKSLEVEIPVKEGTEKVTIVIPEGSQNNDSFEIEGKGIPNSRGVARIFLKLIVPKIQDEELKEKLKEVLEEIEEAKV